jgi:NADPH-dependent curcumin reductase CurA
MTDPDVNRRYLLHHRPSGALTADVFERVEEAVPACRSGHVLVRNLCLSLDPANRGWMNDVPTYRAPVPVGGVMAGFTIGRVVASKRPGFAPGDLVEGDGGWQDYCVYGPEAELRRLPPDTEPLDRMALTGITGRTAYWGLLDIGKPQPGETVVVSAAAGAVGMIAGQIAKLKDCRIIGVAGGPEKCAWLTDELGFDGAIDYKNDHLGRALEALCPDGIDVYFDNTGGDILQAALFRMNLHGRIVCCGVVSQYDTARPAPGPHGMPGLLVVRRLKMEGFIVMDYDSRADKAEADLKRWADEGKIKVRLDILEGLDSAPEGLIGLLAGANKGKRVVRIAAE